MKYIFSLAALIALIGFLRAEEAVDAFKAIGKSLRLSFKWRADLVLHKLVRYCSNS